MEIPISKYRILKIFSNIDFSIVFCRLITLVTALYFVNVIIQIKYIGVELPSLGINLVILGIIWLSLCFFFSQRFSEATIILLSVAASVLWGLFSESVPVSDFFQYHDLSRHLSNGNFKALLYSKSPPTTIYYGFFQYIFGSAYLTNYLASALAWATGTVLISQAIAPFVRDAQKKKFVLTGLAFYPAIILYAPVISSEAVFYLLSSIGIRLISSLILNGRFVTAFYIGLSTGVLFLTRGSGIVFLISVIFFIIFGLFKAIRVHENSAHSQPSIGIAHGFLITFSFSIVLLIHGFLSDINGRGFQLTGSQWGSYVFLSGTNIKSNGGYNVEDLELAGFIGENKTSHQRASKKAVQIARERISSDISGFAEFALTNKIQRLWGDETFALSWTTSTSASQEKVNTIVRPFLWSWLGASYFITLLSFVILLVSNFVNPKSSILLLVMVPILGYALLHVFIEVQSRYHLAFTPFILVPTLLYIHKLFNKNIGSSIGSLSSIIRRPFNT